MSILKKFIDKNASIPIKIIRTSLLSFSLLGAGSWGLQNMTPNRPLTSNETKFLKSLGYDNSIDYSEISIHNSDFIDAFLYVQNAWAITLGNSILVSSEVYSNDFAKESGLKKHVFKHEIGHVWQFSNCFIGTSFNLIADRLSAIVKGNDRASLYEYDVKTEKDLLSYGVEQQAEILASLDKKDSEESKVLNKFRKDPNYAKGCF